MTKAQHEKELKNAVATWIELNCMEEGMDLGHGNCMRAVNTLANSLIKHERPTCEAILQRYLNQSEYQT